MNPPRRDVVRGLEDPEEEGIDILDTPCTLCGMEAIEFDEEKFRELLLYVATRSEDDPKFGAVKLNKILYAIDFSAFANLGKPVTGARYMKLENGPAPRNLLPVRSEMISGPHPVARMERRDYHGYTQDRLVALRPPDMSIFTDAEIQLIDGVIEELRPYSATELSDMSHRWGLGWRLASPEGDIEYEWVFLSGREPTRYEVERGKALAAKYGWLAA